MADVQTRSVGRPLEPFKLWDGWNDEILNLYKTGASDIEIKSLIYFHRGSFSNDLWDRWIADSEEFSETIKIGKMISEAWWNVQGRTNLKVKEFNYVGWYMNMKNRFGWKDKTETALTGADGGPVVITGMEIK